MKFWKEYLIIIFILAFVFFINHLTEKKLEHSITFVREIIQSVENKMKENKKEEAEDEFKQMEKRWKEESETLALFVEHDELEKISNDIVCIQSNFDTNDTDEFFQNMADLKFMLDHVEEKNKLKLKNIF